MGSKLRKKWDLPLERRSALAILAVSFLMGGGGGCLFIALSGEGGSDELCAYLTGYLELAFPAACFLRVFGGRGLLPAFALFGLPALLWAPALFLLGTSGFCSSRRLLGRTLGEGGGSLFPVNWYQAGVCLCLSLTAGLLEFWVVPVLLRGMTRVVL